MVLSSSQVIYFIVFVLIFHINSGQECMWNLNRDLPVNDPIYLKNGADLELLIPNATGLKLALNESIVLLCSGKSNTLSGNGLQEITATCTGNNHLLYNGTNYTLKALSCKNPSYSDLKPSGINCAEGNGEILKIGFTSSKGLVPLIDVCYNKLNETTFYSNHTLYGKAIIGAQSQKKRPNFKMNGLTNGKVVSKQYKRNEQTKRFTTLLGSTQAEKYINKKSFLSRGHLAPGGDFIFRTWRFSSFYLVNVAPEWQTVNGGNWAKVEKLARDLANKKQEDLTIYTGTHGVLNMQNSQNIPIDMYLLDELQLKVPKWFWKVIYSPSTSQGIAMITLNNPHVTNVTKSELLCKNICVGTHWQRPDWTKFDKGYTYCCNVNDLIKTITFLPKMNITSNLLGNGITDKIPRKTKNI